METNFQKYVVLLAAVNADRSNAYKLRKMLDAEKLVFNWNALLDCAPELNIYEIDAIRRLANSWVTCACGQACKALPRRENGSPLDPQLHGLGKFFSDYIELFEYEKAKEILQRIETRTCELLDEINTKLNLS